jgi:hypothetical protein
MNLIRYQSIIFFKFFFNIFGFKSRILLLNNNNSRFGSTIYKAGENVCVCILSVRLQPTSTLQYNP